MIKIFADQKEINDFAADKFVEIGRAAIAERGRFTVALAGGSTPKALYTLLASEKFKNKIDWRKIVFFFGDERDVPIDSDESNFRMANESILRPLDIPAENVFRWQTELENKEKVAEDYRQKIKKLFNLIENELPRFDLVLLGMGDDGHTASLFPFSKALAENEKIAVVNYVEKFDTNRLTFTFPTINNAANVMFLVGGTNKADVLPKVLEGDSNSQEFPSQNVRPTDGNLFWLVDEAAAQKLK